MNKILTITLKEMRAVFTDRSLLLLMFAAPLALATIIAVTFGGAFNSDASPVQDIPVAVVNLDEGTTTINNGAILAGVFLPGAEGSTANENSCPTAVEGSEESSISMEQLVDAVPLDDPAEAKAGVENGIFAAAVIIPADFSQNLTYSATNTFLKPTQIEVYGDPQRPIAASIVRSIVEGVVTQLGTGNVAVAATLNTVAQEYGALQLVGVTTNPGFQTDVACAFATGAAPISVERQTTSGNEPSLNPLVIFGASQAIFFALFAANGSATTLMEERRNWTLQRLLISPTSKLQILLGKMTGTFSIIVVQLVFLFIAFTLVASLLAGELQLIWGTNIIGIIIVLFATCLAVTGLGAIVAAASKTPEQAATVGSILAILMSVLGGSFGFSLGPPLSYFSIVYWGTNAFSKLSVGSNDYGLNVLVLLASGVVMFGIALFVFNRRVSE
jgi:ABC-2 type transport system permease protein